MSTTPAAGDFDEVSSKYTFSSDDPFDNDASNDVKRTPYGHIDSGADWRDYVVSAENAAQTAIALSYTEADITNMEAAQQTSSSSTPYLNRATLRRFDTDTGGIDGPELVDTPNTTTRTTTNTGDVNWLSHPCETCNEPTEICCARCDMAICIQCIRRGISCMCFMHATFTATEEATPVEVNHILIQHGTAPAESVVPGGRMSNTHPEETTRQETRPPRTEWTDQFT